MVDAGEASVTFDTSDTETVVEDTLRVLHLQLRMHSNYTADAAVEIDSDVMTDTTYNRIVTYKGSYAE